MKQTLFTLLLSASTLYASGLFSVGHKNFGFSIGQDSAYNNNYTVIGLNANYFPVENLSVGFGYQTWLGSTPSINQITLPLTYHIPLEMMYTPYIGTFYSHTFIEDPYQDYDSYGGKIGLTMQTSQSSYISFGWVHEIYDDGINSESRGYPEVSAGFSF